MTWADASSDAGLVLFFAAFSLFAFLVLVPFALWLARRWDAWRTARRRNRSYRARRYADP